MMKTRAWWLRSVLFAALLTVACGSEDEAPAPEELEISGSWLSSYGDMEVIDSESWVSYAEVPIIEYDNTANFLVTQNPEDAEYDPGKFNRIVWTEIEGERFYYCTVDFGLASAEDARNSKTEVDDSEPETKGCGTFAWTRLDAAP